MTPYHYMNHVEGLYSDVAPHLVPDNALALMDNVVVTHKIGTIMKRLGYSKVGATIQANKAITGLHNFRQNAATQKMLATINDSTDDDTQLFYKTAAGAWTEITTAETAWANFANMKVEMIDFIGYCFFVGWGLTDGFLPVGSLTGTTFSTSANVTSMPQAKFGIRYRDRLYLLNCRSSGTDYPFRIYHSSVPSAGAITWTPASDFLDVDFSEELTGGGENWDRMVAFTEYSAYMYNQVEFKKVWDVGCTAHRTIKNSGVYMFWCNSDGVWASTSGRPENISGRVVDFFRYSDPTSWFAEVIDEEYYVYVGSVTVNGVGYTNCRVVFNIPTKTWRVEEMYDTHTVYARFNSSGKQFLYMGASDGDVQVMSKYSDASPVYGDDGQPIHSWFQTGALSFGDPSVPKMFPKALVYADRAQGVFMKARVVDRNAQVLSDFLPLGQIMKYINEFQISPSSGHFLQFEGVENSKDPYWSVFGYTILVGPDGATKA